MTAGDPVTNPLPAATPEREPPPKIRWTQDQSGPSFNVPATPSEPPPKCADEGLQRYRLRGVYLAERHQMGSVIAPASGVCWEITHPSGHHSRVWSDDEFFARFEKIEETPETVLRLLALDAANDRYIRHLFRQYEDALAQRAPATPVAPPHEHRCEKCDDNSCIVEDCVCKCGATFCDGELGWSWAPATPEGHRPELTYYEGIVKRVADIADEPTTPKELAVRLRELVLFGHTYDVQPATPESEPPPKCERCDSDSPPMYRGKDGANICEDCSMKEHAPSTGWRKP